MNQQRHQPENINQKHQSGLNVQDRIALGITNAVGTMYAVYLLILLLAGWMFWQSKLSNAPFDPYPFAFLLFLGNIVQLLLMPLIMVGQNLQSRHSEARAEEEYKRTVSSYKDLEEVMQRLDRIEALLNK